MNKNDKPSPLKIPAALISGAVQAGIGLIGGKKRKRALARAQGAYDMQKQRFENMDTSNPYANMENVYEEPSKIYRNILTRGCSRRCPASATSAGSKKV